VIVCGFNTWSTLERISPLVSLICLARGSLAQVSASHEPAGYEPSERLLRQVVWRSCSQSIDLCDAKGMTVLCGAVKREMASSKHYATFRFYADLNDFLPAEHRTTSFRHEFELYPSIKDMIESLGVPHTEIDLILVNGSPVDFTHGVKDGDWISIYPAFSRLDTSPLLQLRPRLTDFRFVLDTHLGRLATYLRLLGFDSVYDNGAEDKELARVSHCEGRILLTRDTGLLKRNDVVHGYYVRETQPLRQAIEVVGRFDLLRSHTIPNS